jgi:hypothetical protein
MLKWIFLLALLVPATAVAQSNPAPSLYGFIWDQSQPLAERQNCTLAFIDDRDHDKLKCIMYQESETTRLLILKPRPANGSPYTSEEQDSLTKFVCPVSPAR